MISVLSQSAALTLAVLSPTWTTVGLVLITFLMTAYVSWLNRSVNLDLDVVKLEIKVLQDQISGLNIMQIGRM